MFARAKTIGSKNISLYVLAKRRFAMFRRQTHRASQTNSWHFTNKVIVALKRNSSLY